MAVRPLDLNGTVARTRTAVVAIDARGRITLWNRAAKTLLGYPAREVIGRLSCEVFRSAGHVGDTLCYRGCHVGLGSLDAPVQNFDMRAPTNTGRPIRVNVSVLVIDGPERQGPTVLHLLRDVTAAKTTVAPVRPRVAVAGPDGHGTPLTRREIDVLRLMGAGMNTRTIAGTLRVSSATVRNHVQSILGKLGVHSRLAAVAFAHGHGLL